MISFAAKNVTGVDIGKPADEASDVADLIARRCAEGDPEGFAALYDRWQAPMRNVATHLLGSPSDAEDAVQETMVKVARSIRRFDFRSKFSTWLFTILMNTCRDHLRLRSRRIETNPIEPLSHGVAGPADEPTIRMTLRRLVASLPEKERIVFVLYEVEGFSHAEIAEVLGKSESYSKWLLFTTKKRLREELRNEGELP